jgi:hypothetical protein
LFSAWWKIANWCLSHEQPSDNAQVLFELKCPMAFHALTEAYISPFWPVPPPLQWISSVVSQILSKFQQISVISGGLFLFFLFFGVNSRRAMYWH